MKIDQLFESGDDLASQFAQMAKEKGMNVRVRGTPDQERQRTQDMLAQRRSDQEKQSQLAGEKDFANLDQLEAEYAKMKDEYQSLGGSNWQYADREQNLSASERKARSMEDVLRALWSRIQRAKKQGMAEGSLNELSKDTLKSYSNERGATIHADQRDAGGARTMAADKKKHGDTKASADWDDEASWLDKRAEKGAKGVAQATTKIAKKGVAEGHPDEKEDKALIRKMVKQQALKKENMLAREQHEDHEISMATSELKNVYINAKKLFDIIKQRSEQEGLDAWQQSKITKASDYLNSVLTAIRGEPRR
jgi:hypothetical protein